MSQVADTKFILDATAGFRMMWKNKHHPNCLYTDDRLEVNPDEIQDFRHLTYPNERFFMVIFDPPHIIQKARGNMARDFGVLNPDTWAKDLELGFKECWRVLKPHGVLIFKWSELCHKKLSQIEPYYPAEPLFTHVGKYVPDTRGRVSKTFFVCFMKIPEEEKP